MKRKIVWCSTAVLFAVLLLLLAQSIIQSPDRPIRYMGVPDGAAGLLARYVLTERVDRHTIEAVQFEPYTLYDCCASSSQYALGSGRLDMAIMCPDAARALVARDSRFEIAGPVMMNSDIIITVPDADLQEPAIAVSRQRLFQQQMVSHYFGDTARAVPMIHTAVPYAYTRGVVQGAVVDITKSFDLAGLPVAPDAQQQDICTYVLVIKTSLKTSPQYLDFIDRYSNAVEELTDSKKLLHILQTYAAAHITMGDVETWTRMNVHYTCPLIYPPQG